MLELDYEYLDIIALTRFIADSVRHEADERKIRIIINAAPQQVMMVYADKGYLEQVLVNLIVNSVHYGKEGGITRISFIDFIDKVMVEISDTGIGISQEDLPHVFERFYRADKSRSRESGGTGLGLAIVKRVLNAHNESIAVRSAPEQGATFSFTLRKKVSDDTTLRNLHMFGKTTEKNLRKLTSTALSDNISLNGGFLLYL